jgi:hypothetical protein
MGEYLLQPSAADHSSVAQIALAWWAIGVLVEGGEVVEFSGKSGSTARSDLAAYGQSDKMNDDIHIDPSRLLVTMRR